MREKIDTEIVREEKQKQSKSASKKSKREELKGEVNITEHMLSHEELFKQMVTDPETGLNKDEAQMRLERDGPNVLTPAKTTPLWRLFINQLIGGFQMLLWAAALLAFISYGINSEIASENVLFCYFSLHTDLHWHCIGDRDSLIGALYLLPRRFLS